MESVCSPFNPAPDPAALFERLTAIVETTTAHLNAISSCSGRGIGGGTGRKTVFVLPKEPIPDPQTGVTVPGIGPETGNLAAVPS